MTEDKLLGQVIISLVVGLIGLIPILMQRLSNKRREKSYSNQLNKLQVELDFLEKWKNFSSTIHPEQNTDSGQIIGSSLDSILEKYKILNENEVKFDQQDEVADIKQISIFRRIFLLFKPKSFSGGILHTIFYFILLFSTVMILSEFIAPTVDSAAGENEFFNLILGVVVIFGIPAIIIQRYAIRIAKRDFSKE